jgi:hypothetical protein
MGLLAQKANFDSIYARSGTVHTAGAGLPDAVAVAIAMGQAALALLAVSRPRQASTSSSISRWTAKPIISRNRSASGVFSTKRPQVHPVGRTLDEACPLAVRPLKLAAIAASRCDLTCFGRCLDALKPRHLLRQFRLYGT